MYRLKLRVASGSGFFFKSGKVLNWEHAIIMISDRAGVPEAEPLPSGSHLPLPDILGTRRSGASKYI